MSSKRDSLKDYQNKRNTDRTPEPEGQGASANQHSDKLFVIQKHDATTLHYDFRLAIDGVLKSWAVPKGLSTAADEKRLAVRTDDHPLEYAEFEGIIPEGEYGAGTVMVWDIGSYKPIVESNGHDKPMQEALDEGAIKFELQGEKLQGGYAMARMDDNDSDQEQWLIFKLDDGKADARRHPQNTQPDSALTDRSLKDIEKEEDRDA